MAYRQRKAIAELIDRPTHSEPCNFLFALSCEEGIVSLLPNDPAHNQTRQNLAMKNQPTTFGGCFRISVLVLFF